VLERLDLALETDLFPRARGVDLVELGNEVELDAPQVAPIASRGQLALEGGPVGARCSASAIAEPDDLTFVGLDGSLELRALGGALVPGRHPGGAGLLFLRECGGARPRRVERALERALRGLLLAPVEVDLEHTPDRPHDDPDVLVPGESALKRR